MPEACAGSICCLFIIMLCGTVLSVMQVYRRVVPEASATPPPGWQHNVTVRGADHFEVCRATSEASLVLLDLVALLQDLGAT